MTPIAAACSLLPLLTLGVAAAATAAPPFSLEDVFALEYAEDPRIAPDGERIVYIRQSMDRMSDRVQGSLWSVGLDGGQHRPMATGFERISHPRWSPDGERLAWIGTRDGETHIWVRWIDSGQTAPISRPNGRPESLSWSPDGAQLAFTMRVPEEAAPLATLPRKPKGAKWAEAAKLIDTLVYRSDGRGFLEKGYSHVFVVPADGGTPRQVTSGPFNHDGEPAWLPTSTSLVISANRRPDWEYEPLDSDLWQVSIEDGTMRVLTTRYGPDRSPVVSPDGGRIAFIGFDDNGMGFHTERLYLLNRSNRQVTVLTPELDASVRAPAWDSRGRGVYFLYDREGRTRLARIDVVTGAITELADDVGGTSIGRPYASGSFSVAAFGTFAYTATAPDFPADVAAGDGRRIRRLTRLNDDLLPFRSLGRVESFRAESSFDQRDIQAWLVLPPGFDPARRWPLILEIHGGPYANYGPRFSAEMQLYAAAGYVVLYVNPRGSTSYGEAFANLIEKNYPGQDYDDLMSAVDAVLARGYIDPGRLYVTGGSGGGVLTAWIVGKTERFRAAAVVKPVINWTSFALTADNYNFYYRYWFDGPPWEEQADYWRRSPLSLVGNVSTPTLVMSGEQDFRTPMSEAEQYYQALRLRRVDSVLVRVPGAAHNIAARPTHLMAKVANILAWFERYAEPGVAPVEVPPVVSDPDPDPDPEPEAEESVSDPESEPEEPVFDPD
jgi:dipeptidyl aminopeptidase/acylaminoacyl peptidase